MYNKFLKSPQYLECSLLSMHRNRTFQLPFSCNSHMLSLYFSMSPSDPRDWYSDNIRYLRGLGRGHRTN